MTALSKADGAAWLAARDRAVRRLARGLWPLAACEDAASEALARSLHRPPGTAAWWWLYLLGRRFLAQRGRGDGRGYRGPRGAGVFSLASHERRGPDNDAPTGPDDWIAKHIAAPPAVTPWRLREAPTFADDLAFLFNDVGLTGYEIAQVTGDSACTVYGWVRGDSRPMSGARARLRALANRYERVLAADLGQDPPDIMPVPPVVARAPRRSRGTARRTTTPTSQMVTELRSRGWTLRALAQRLGVGHASINRWANGVTPDRDLVAALRALVASGEVPA